MTLAWPAKDPDELLDHGIDWTARLAEAPADGTDTIATSTWTLVEGDVTIDHDTNDTAQTAVWLAGGTAGTTSVLNNTIVTAQDRVFNLSVKVKVKNK